MGYKIGVDVGGTFTDVCMFNEEDGKAYVYKLPSTPWDPSEAIGDGIKNTLKEFGVSPKAVSYLAHGTTVATNATLERKGARTALITTKGFRDLIELARQKRASLFDVQVDKPVPIIHTELRYEINERMDYQGNVLIPIDREEVCKVVDELKAKNVTSYAVVFLHSYVNPSHEKLVKEVIQERHPEAYVSISSEVLPEYREYERTTTTALNSYIGPKVGVYANLFKQRIKDMGIQLTPYINQSNGGLMSIETTFQNPIRTALSGPAAGVSGANYICRLAGIKDVITFDMGGTSTDVSLFENNSPKITTQKNIAEFPTKVPMTDVTAVGAGGGSIAWIDNGGMLKVGPESAGAYPGPISYGRGGKIPTVTDANVVLRRLNPEYILGGKMKIDYQAAYTAIEEQMAKPLGMNVIDAARGIITVVNSNMTRAIRVVSVERGYDPRRFVLMAFGGAGALHAAYVAKEIGIKNILIPANAGILCAIGLLTSDIRSDYVRTNIGFVDYENVDTMNKVFDELVKEGDEWLANENIPEKERLIQKFADIRYFGQNYELTIPVEEAVIDEKVLDKLKETFHREHNREYGHCNPKAAIQVVNYRVVAFGKVSKIQLKEYPESGKDSETAVIARREVFFDELGFTNVKIYDRDLLETGNVVAGPAVIEEMDSTIVVPPSFTATVDKYHNLMLHTEE